MEKLNSDRGRERYSDPAMAKVRFSRVSGWATLFASDVRHQHYITLSISRADLTRDLGQDWIHSTGRDLIEVAMSPTQFADLLTNMNTDGVPATLSHFNGESFEYPGIETRSDVMRRESTDKLSEALESAREAAKEVQTVLESDKPLGKSTMRELIAKMKRFEDVVMHSMPFMADQFQRYMDRVTTEAKASVEAYLDSKLTSLGLAALKEEVRVKFLSDETRSRKEE